MAVSSYGERLIPYCEEKGSLEVKRLRLQNHFHSLDWSGVDKWLLFKDAEALERAERRDETNLSVSRKALRISVWAAIIAIISIVVSIKEQLLALLPS